MGVLRTFSALEIPTMLRWQSLVVTVALTASLAGASALGATSASAAVATAPTGSATSVAYVNRIVVLVSIDLGTTGPPRRRVSPVAPR